MLILILSQEAAKSTSPLERIWFERYPWTSLRNGYRKLRLRCRPLLNGLKASLRSNYLTYLHSKLQFAISIQNPNSGPVRLIISSQTRALILPFRSRSEEHTSELQSLMRISYAVFCLKKKKQQKI